MRSSHWPGETASHGTGKANLSRTGTRTVSRPFQQPALRRGTSTGFHVVAYVAPGAHGYGILGCTVPPLTVSSSTVPSVSVPFGCGITDHGTFDHDNFGYGILDCTVPLAALTFATAPPSFGRPPAASAAPRDGDSSRTKGRGKGDGCRSSRDACSTMEPHKGGAPRTPPSPLR